MSTPDPKASQEEDHAAFLTDPHRCATAAVTLLNDTLDAHQLIRLRLPLDAGPLAHDILNTLVSRPATTART